LVGGGVGFFSSQAVVKKQTNNIATRQIENLFIDGLREKVCGRDELGPRTIV